MGDRCAVQSCRNNFVDKTRHSYNSLSFFGFPHKNPTLLNCWMLQCQRSEIINPLHAKICSDHFKKSDFVPDLRSDLVGCREEKRLLENAVPSLNLPRRSVRKRENPEGNVDSCRLCRPESTAEKTFHGNGIRHVCSGRGNIGNTTIALERPLETGAQRETEIQNPSLNFVSIPGSGRPTVENCPTIACVRDPLSLAYFQNSGDINSKNPESEIQNNTIPIVRNKKPKIGTRSQSWNSIGISDSALSLTDNPLKILNVCSVRDSLSFGNLPNSDEYSLISSMEVETENPGQTSIVVKDEVSSDCAFSPVEIGIPASESFNDGTFSFSPTVNCEFESEIDPLEDILETKSINTGSLRLEANTLDKFSEMNLLRKELFDVKREVLHLRQENEDLRLKLKYSYVQQLADSKVATLMQMEKYEKLDLNLTEIFSPAQLKILNGGAADWEDEVIKKAQSLKNLMSDKAYDTLVLDWRLPIPTLECLHRMTQDSQKACEVTVSEDINKT